MKKYNRAELSKLGNYILDLQENNNETGYEMAKKLNIDKTHLSKIMRDRTAPIAILQKISEIYKVDLLKLIKLGYETTDIGSTNYITKLKILSRFYSLINHFDILKSSLIRNELLEECLFAICEEKYIKENEKHGIAK